jgi:hypothetical protein
VIEGAEIDLDELLNQFCMIVYLSWGPSYPLPEIYFSWLETMIQFSGTFFAMIDYPAARSFALIDLPASWHPS